MNRYSPHATVAAFGALAAASALLLGGCAVSYPPTPQTVLSQLPESPHHVPTPLTPAEKRRYDEIGRQVLREQDAAMQADARAWSWYPYAVTPMYGGYDSGRWRPGWGVGSGWGYPGYYPGW
ncbi:MULTISPECIES: hypothetical protein [Burkholderiaceae]|uniref:hypothetical protein n=1 Tax=Burkholderiaceae TaxID=119060 RepID=UPI00095EBCAE|nr:MULTISPECIES: hypothetical protein [Burkholderiaceae]MCF2134094.1 hypothetical protein [Mycetohabitans sp. B3]MCG1018869.1 hypothetical protein [Mycetohabitans sp. B4]MCG1039646.1 hypothetical protein [Mycetohabitans sp. B7]SIT70309.1 hypothetical protein SAMN04487769_1660 [Burkholderia sp. b14]